MSDDEVPLARLFAVALRTLIDDLHDGLVERGWVDVRRSYGFVLLALRERETTTTELAGLLGVSKQATSKQLDAMETGGYVRRAGLLAVLHDRHGAPLPQLRPPD